MNANRSTSDRTWGFARRFERVLIASFLFAVVLVLSLLSMHRLEIPQTISNVVGVVAVLSIGIFGMRIKFTRDARISRAISHLAMVYSSAYLIIFVLTELAYTVFGIPFQYWIQSVSIVIIPIGLIHSYYIQSQLSVGE